MSKTRLLAIPATSAYRLRAGFKNPFESYEHATSFALIGLSMMGVVLVVVVVVVVEILDLAIPAVSGMTVE